MALTIEEVRKIAALARLRLSPEEEAKFLPQLGRIVDYIDQLRQFESIAEPRGEGAAVREQADVPRPGPGLEREAFLANAPQAMGSFLLVPEVKGGGEES